MMQQYREAKAHHPGMLLLFRQGDAYEAYDADAVKVSNLLGLTLTTKGGAAMAFFLHHQLEAYLRKLLHAGERVAVCDQEAPKDAKVARAVMPPNGDKGAADD